MLKTLFSIAFLLILIVVPSVNIYAIGGKVKVTAELPAHKADKFFNERTTRYNTGYGHGCNDAEYWYTKFSEIDPNNANS